MTARAYLNSQKYGLFCSLRRSLKWSVTYRIGVYTEPESFTACTKTILDSLIIASVFDFNYHSIKIYLFNAFEELEECGDKKNAILLNLGISFCGKITQRTISSKSTLQIILGER